MTRKQLPVAHLSDEAIAAVSDGVLRGTPLARAERHLANCLECAQEVVQQRQASFALRAAGTPTLPGDLMERLCGLPLTVPLTGAQTGAAAAAVTEEGEALFAAFPVAVPASGPSSGRVAGAPRRWLGR